MNKMKHNVFFVDTPIQDMLDTLSGSTTNGFLCSSAGNSVILSNSSGPEKKTILFRPEESLFTYEVNGHFFGKFYYVDDKVIAKWPTKLSDEEKGILVREIQTIFRNLH